MRNKGAKSFEEKFKEERMLKWAFMVVTFASIVLLSYVLYFMLGTYEYTEVEFIGLDENEINESEDLIARLNPEYTKFTKKIIIIKDLKGQSCNKRFSISRCKFCREKGCAGFFHFFTHTAVVEFSDEKPDFTF